MTLAVLAFLPAFFFGDPYGAYGDRWGGGGPPLWFWLWAMQQQQVQAPLVIDRPTIIPQFTQPSEAVVEEYGGFGGVGWQPRTIRLTPRATERIFRVRNENRICLVRRDREVCLPAD